jgi:hypothetical protein
VKKAECPQTKPAVVIDGADAEKVLHACCDEQCKVHSRLTRYEGTPKERAARAKELLAGRVEKLTRVRILSAICRKLRASLSRPDLEMAALDYFVAPPPFLMLPEPMAFPTPQSASLHP